MQHLIVKNPDPPKINALIVPRAKNHLWTQIVRCSAKGIPDRPLIIGPAKIGYFHLPLGNQNILRLEISVYHRRAETMQISNCLKNLPNLPETPLLIEVLIALYEVVQIPLAGELHQHEDISLVLEDLVKGNDVRMLAFGENLDFLF